ncbi:hypothetical protein N7U66_19040 [Lacinutrix neustonica]|uniref:Sugar transporter n=1 Tax=Lacinutrix neustonica TaxID=2980107 RepID=A0A9E8MWK2_9FLAO|nr:hypothetical protein [Lacinutrix neustonica]WAC01917.1 hypothetical protein N7U66_19040 [Lacinutrix neustonica]
MNDEFDLLESSTPAFDIKAFLFRTLRYWKLFLLCIGIGLFFAYQQNIRKQQSYSLNTQISIEDNTNPLFSSNTSLTFNWGGVYGKIRTIITTLRSRSIHEKVVDSLEYYVTYLKQSRFRKDDIYKAAPFKFELTPNAYQMLNMPIKVSYLGEGVYELHVVNDNGTTKVLDAQNFSDKTKGQLTINP